MTGKTTTGTRTQFSTYMADLGSVFRIDHDYFNSLSLCLILDEELQLVETPVANPIIHSSSFSLFSYSFEVFHHNLVAAEFSNYLFADIMVYPLHPTSFSSGEFLEQPLAGTSAFALKFGTQIFELSFNMFDFGGIIKSVDACDSEVIYSQINTENNISQSIVNGINILTESEQKENSAFFIHSQEAFAYFPREVFFVAFRDIEFELLPFVNQTQNKNVPFEVCASLEVVPDRSVIDNWFGFSFLDHPAGLFDAGNSELRRQSLPQSFIHERMQFNVISDIILPCSINTELQPLAVGFNGVNYFRGGSNLKFCCSDNLHRDTETFKLFKPGAGVWQVASGGEWGNHSNLWSIKPKRK